MDILAKYDQLAERRALVLSLGEDPLGVSMEKVLSPTEAIINGKKTLLAGTNNYLGLTFDPDCIDAAVTAIQEQGTGTTGSRIANGTYEGHRKLEEEMARFYGRKTALVFSTGYQANLGTIAGLAGTRDTILLDADSHASLYDACTLSGAKTVRFRHNNPADLDKRLTRLGAEGGAKLVVVESIYSMFGDAAPIAEFAEVTHRHGGALLVDEAHSMGVYGARGRGLVEELGLEDQVDFIVGTFSKSLGAMGGFAVSDHPRFDILRYCSRPYMYTASSSPATIASVTAALKRIESDQSLRTRIRENAEALYAGLTELGFEVCSSGSPIVAVKMPDDATTAIAWNHLLNDGVYVNLAVPPGTPNGACLLRCSVSSAHTLEQIDTIVERFSRLRQYMSVDAQAAPAAE